VCSPCYPPCNAHVPYCLLWPSQFSSISPHYFTNDTIFEEKKTLLNTIWVSSFSKILCGTFSILRGTERVITENVYIGLHVKYPLFVSDFNET